MLRYNQSHLSSAQSPRFKGCLLFDIRPHFQLKLQNHQASPPETRTTAQREKATPGLVPSQTMPFPCSVAAASTFSIWISILNNLWTVTTPQFSIQLSNLYSKHRIHTSHVTVKLPHIQHHQSKRMKKIHSQMTATILWGNSFPEVLLETRLVLWSECLCASETRVWKADHQHDGFRRWDLWRWSDHKSEPTQIGSGLW